MKRNILIGLMFLVGISCIIILVNIENTQDNKKIIDTVVEGNVETKVDTVLDRLKENDFEKLDNKSAIETYKLEEIPGLDVGVYLRENASDFEEISIIRFGDNNLSEKIQEKVIGRLIELTKKYEGNEKVLAIIQNNENFVIKQEGGVQTVIISENAKELAEKLKIQF